MRNSIRVLSPVFASVLMSILGLMFTFFPPKMYSDLLFEKSYMYLDYTLWTFVLLCVGGFIAGCMYSQFIMKKLAVEYLPPVLVKRQYLNILVLTALLLIWMRLGYTVNSLGIGLTLDVLGGNPGISITEYRNIYDSLQSRGFLPWIFSITFVILNAGLWYALSGHGNIYMKAMIFLGYVGVILQALLSQTRGSLLISLGGIFLIYISNKIVSQRADLARLAFTILIVITAVSFAFIAIDIRRGGLLSNSSNGFLYTLVGYFISEFNRLSRILDGSLVIPDAGSQSYAFYNLLYPPLSGRISLFNFGSMLGFKPVDYAQSWTQSFLAVRSAGLNENFNWYTVFGAVFSDLKWFSPFWFFGYGVLCQFFWIHFKRGSLLGIVVYPWFWISILTWWGAFNVLISSPDTVLIIFFGITVYALGNFLRRRGVLRGS